MWKFLFPILQIGIFREIAVGLGMRDLEERWDSSQLGLHRGQEKEIKVQELLWPTLRSAVIFPEPSPDRISLLSFWSCGLSWWGSALRDAGFPPLTGDGDLSSDKTGPLRAVICESDLG